MNILEQIREQIREVVAEMGAFDVQAVLERSADTDHGDYTTNVAFVLSKKLCKSPIEVAEKICEGLRAKGVEGMQRIEAVKPGFVNFYLSEEYLLERMRNTGDSGLKTQLWEKRIMVEFAHPNTHKEMHIGHMRTLITGEALARLLEYSGAKVFRANYQGDIGLHVAKAMFGLFELLKKESLSLNKIDSRSAYDQAHFLGKAYVYGSQVYDENKEEIDSINKELYQKVTDYLSTKTAEDLLVEKAEGDDLFSTYIRTRRWSLIYYDEFYRRFYTKFDRLFFESEMSEAGIKLVNDHVGDIFEKSEGALVFKGEKYGVHTRVFVTGTGNPLYEAKDLGNAVKQYEAFPFDLNIHVVASEQAGYFQVVIKALELLDSEKFEGKEKHLSMGMVTLTDRKMSSRTGDVLTVDWLLDQVKERVEKFIAEGRVNRHPGGDSIATLQNDSELIEQIVVGAVKYSVLKVGTGQNVSFDIEKSVSLEGNSGPYIQYTYARTQSLLRKSQISHSLRSVRANFKSQINLKFQISNFQLGEEDLKLLRLLVHFEDVVNAAAEKYSPSLVADYLFELCQAFNLFYQKAQILKEKEDLRNFRLMLTARIGEIIKSGLDLLGIKAPERM